MPRPVGALAALAFAVALLAVPAAAQPNEAHAAAKQQAQRAAASWLALVDNDEFEASWDAAAPLLQKRIERESWVQKARRLRDTVQAPSTRTLEMTQFRASLQRAPGGGPFVLLKYRSTFEGGRFEELLLTVRQDATWKVTGYQVTPLRPPIGGTTAPAPDSSGR
jgi:hypothetical protein